MTEFHRLTGQCRRYAWGGPDYINTLLSKRRDGVPVAEYWLGAHPTAPSTVELSGKTRALDELIRTDPDFRLVVNETKQPDLPYLFKVLDVARPLSIQVHPNREQAEAGFDRETEAGISIDDPARNYVDRNAKPELAVALSDFYLLYGFRPIDAVRQSLATHRSLQPLLQQASQGGIEALFRRIMASTDSERAAWLRPLFPECAEVSDRTDYRYWMSQWHHQNPDPDQQFDRGVLCMMLMNVVHLSPGEAIFQDSNIPHAYLSGQCIEAMTNSDNVLRCGLTPKHVDIDELLQTISFSSEPVTKVSATLINNGQDDSGHSARHHSYAVPVPDFIVERISISTTGRLSLIAGTILMVLNGQVEIGAGLHQSTLCRGEAIYVSAHSDVEISTDSSGCDIYLCRPGT